MAKSRVTRANGRGSNRRSLPIDGVVCRQDRGRGSRADKRCEPANGQLRSFDVSVLAGDAGPSKRAREVFLRTAPGSWNFTWPHKYECRRWHIGDKRIRQLEINAGRGAYTREASTDYRLGILRYRN